MSDNELDFDFSESGEIEVEVDSSNAETPDGWYLCKITSANCKKKFNEKVGDEVINASFGLLIDEGPYAGGFASMYFPVSDPRQFASKTRMKVLQALGLTKDEAENTRFRITRNTEGNAELQGFIGERIGCMLKNEVRDERTFLQVHRDNVCRPEDLPSSEDDSEAPF